MSIVDEERLLDAMNGFHLTMLEVYGWSDDDSSNGVLGILSNVRGREHVDVIAVPIPGKPGLSSVDTLAGSSPSDAVLAIPQWIGYAVSAETWIVFGTGPIPDDHVRPSQDPQRQTARTTMAVLSDGTCAMVSTVKDRPDLDYGGIVDDSMQHEGRMETELRRWCIQTQLLINAMNPH